MVFAAVRDLIWPATCACNPRDLLATRSRYAMCTACEELLEANDGVRCAICDAPGRACCSSGLAMRAPFLYGGPLAEVIAAAKFRGREDLARGLGRLLADHVGPLSGVVVPIPLARGRRFERGYNQSVLIAREVARGHRLRLVHGLARTRKTGAQHLLPLAQRAANIANAFTARVRFTGPVVLVDDVITSGATMRSAAQALREAGATEVYGVAVARTP